MGNHGCLRVVTSWHTLQIGLYIWSVEDSHEHQRDYPWALALLSSHMHLELGVCEQWIDANMGDGCMCGLNKPFLAPGADNVHRRFGLGPPWRLLREEAL